MHRAGIDDALVPGGNEIVFARRYGLVGRMAMVAVRVFLIVLVLHSDYSRSQQLATNEVRGGPGRRLPVPGCNALAAGPAYD